MMSALYTGTSGMKALSQGMSSIGNNLANTNTVGFKAAMMLYQDMTSSDVTGTGGNYANGNIGGNLSQLGHGVSVMVNRTMYKQGAFEPGNDPMDMGISGIGFFGVQKDGELQFTRAGNFRFTKDGDLVDPNGYGLMGSKIVNGVVSNTVEPIKLDLSTGGGHMTMQPRATSSVTLIENLGSVEDKTSGANEFFSLAGAWNGTNTPPLGKGQYSHASAITVYDATGKAQQVTAYFDHVGTYDGKNVYEYVLATNPAADGSARAKTEAAGLLAAGTMTFSSTGEIMDMTMFDAPTANHTDFSTWTPSGFDADGRPAVKADFGAGAQAISMDFGLETGGTWSHGYADAAAVAANPAALHTGPGKPAAANHSTSYQGSSANISSSQNGYAEGNLMNLQVTRDGYVSGNYNNGQSQDLFRVPLYRFTSQDNLRHEGGNRYSAGPDAGNVEYGYPNEENFGALYGQHLEQSNVDMATEFASMIMTQRGFQMNSKVITTSDTMLQRALELKRQ